MVTLSRSFEPDLNRLGSSITKSVGNISQSWWPQQTVCAAVHPLDRERGSGDTLMLLRRTAHPTKLLMLLLAVCCEIASLGPRCSWTWKAPLGTHCILLHAGLGCHTLSAALTRAGSGHNHTF